MDGGKKLPIPGPTRAFAYSTAVGTALAFNFSVQKYQLLPTVLYASIGMQVGCVVGIPLFVLLMRWKNRRAGANSDAEQQSGIGLPSRWGPLSVVLGSISSYCVLHFTDELDIWILAAAFQTAAYVVLAAKVFSKQSVAGISVGKLTLDALALSLRVIALARAGIRMPREADNDSIKAAELSSLVIALALLLAAQLFFRRTYQREADTFRVAIPGLGCLLLALVLRADVMQAGWISDALWTAALYLDAVAMLPQMQLFARNGGVADEAMGHHVVLMFCSRFLGLHFWWMIKGHWYQGMSYTGWAIMILYYAQLLLLSNFFPAYLKGIFTNGVLRGVPIVCS